MQQWAESAAAAQYQCRVGGQREISRSLEKDVHGVLLHHQARTFDVRAGKALAADEADSCELQQKQQKQAAGSPGHP